MKFRFKNLGPIKEADLELGDLTIIAGRNNTGKTYLVYTLYGFLKRWNWSAGWLLNPTREEGVEGLEDFSSLALQAAREGFAKRIFSRRRIEQQRSVVAKEMADAFSTSALAPVFSSQRERFEGASVELTSSLPENAPPPEIIYTSAGSCRVSWEEDKIVLSVDVPQGQPESRPAIFALRNLYYRFLFPEFAIDPIVLTSERFGISLFHRELDFTKNNLVDLLQKMRDESSRDQSDLFLLIDRATSRYALPVKDNIDYTRSIPDLKSQQSELSKYKLPKELRGLTKSYYRSSGDNIEITSTSRGPGRFSIPLHLASSSARGLSDLYFFLQHVAGRNHLLIIEEPESHLDTDNQVLIARLLVRCVHVGMKVLITTHSDYLVKELNNLVMLSHDFEGKQDLLKELDYTADDALDPGRIRAYVAADGTLTACLVDKYGMDMPNFDRTIDDINRVTNEISSRIFESEGS